MLKRTFLLTLIAALCVLPTQTEPYNGRLVTVTAATAIRVVGIRTIVSQIHFQMAIGSSGALGYVLYAPTDVTCANAGAGTTLVAQLAPATTTVPGTVFSLPGPNDAADGLDLQNFCVDGGHSGDVVIISWNKR